MPARLILSALCALFTASLLAMPASAGVPDPRFSTIDVTVVGSPTGVAIGGTPAGFDVTVRDVSNAPLAGKIVELYIGAPDFKLYATQAAGTTIDCANGKISRVTNAAGQVNFVARFGGWADGNAVLVKAEGVILGTVKGRSPDYDRDGKVGLNDLVVFTLDFLTPSATMRSDFDLSGAVGLGDFTIFSNQYNVTPQTLCP
jgi:hypothetical protein